MLFDTCRLSSFLLKEMLAHGKMLFTFFWIVCFTFGHSYNTGALDDATVNIQNLKNETTRQIFENYSKSAVIERNINVPTQNYFVLLNLESVKIQQQASKNVYWIKYFIGETNCDKLKVCQTLQNDIKNTFLKIFYYFSCRCMNTIASNVC